MTDDTHEPSDEPQSHDADEPGPANVVVEPGGAELKLTGSQAGRIIRDYMAVDHLWAAQRWARMRDEAESKLVADGSKDTGFRPSLARGRREHVVGRVPRSVH